MNISLPFLDAVDIPLWSILVPLCIYLLYLYGTSPFKLWKTLGVPGPDPAPFFGNTMDLYGPDSSKAAYAKWHAKYGRVYGIYFFRHPALVVTDPELMKQILVKDFNSFRDRMAYDKNILLNREVESGVFFAKGDMWKRIRGIVSPSFSIAKIRAMTGMVNRSAERLGEHVLKFAQDGVPWGAKLFYGAYALDVVTGTGFSIDVDSVSNLDEPFTRHGRSLFIYKNSIKFLAFLAGSLPAVASFIKKFIKVGFFKTEDMDFFDENIKYLVKERKENSGQIKYNDFLQHLVSAEAETIGEDMGSKLSPEEIVGQGIMLFIAGYETASSTLQFLTYELAKNPYALNKIIAEIDEVIGTQDPTYDLCLNLKYTEAAINETLRLYPPLSVLTRQCSQPTKLNEWNLPADTGVVMPLYNIQRDPEFWKDPDTFNPDRFVEGSPTYEPYDPFTFIPFGVGPRICVGMKLGMLEMKLALIHILRRVSLAKATPENLHINDFTSILQPSIPIMVYATPRY